jgi:hypothetical protein
VFDAASGEHERTIGARGSGPAQFGLPRGLARTPEGHVCVVDTLNDRVQVFDAQGNWLRDIGRPGDNVGSFGRPKCVAVGPDGTVFVTDAFSQRVHAFAPDGHPLLAFGEPGSGIGEMTLPSGIAVAAVHPPTREAPPPDVMPEYYVLVGAELERPGIRVYAWLGEEETRAGGPLPNGFAVDWRPRSPESESIDPHWKPDQCTACHPHEDDRLLPIPRAEIDGLCLSCHDGVRAPADPHPIGRPADTELVHTPPDWPTEDGMIGCLTCHNIKMHCNPAARPPATNVFMLRDYDPQRRLDYCMNCHLPGTIGRFSPHRQRDTSARVREDACYFCHVQMPPIPPDGRRTFEPHLRDNTSRLCLNCHTRHWDLSPRGHVDRPVTPRIRHWMLMRQLSLEVTAGPKRLAELAAESHEPPALLPLGGDDHGLVTCFTCHNPHYAGLFPPGSELGALAGNPTDRAAALRVNFIDLCSECHHR